MSKIEGVFVTPLRVIPDERGKVMHVLRADSSQYCGFGETYISVIFPNVTKGWKRHVESTSNIAVPIGKIEFFLVDAREGSKTQSVSDRVVIGEDAYSLLTIPPGVVYAWRNSGEKDAYVVNCASVPWSQSESITLPMETYPIPE